MPLTGDSEPEKENPVLTTISKGKSSPLSDLKTRPWLLGGIAALLLSMPSQAQTQGRNLRLASQSNPHLAGNDALFTVSESDQNSQDLNGDGDISDQVVHFYDGGRDRTTNLRRASDLGPPRLSRELAAFSVPESGQGNADLNNDGDLSDSVVHVYDTQSGTLRNLRFAIGLIEPRVAGPLAIFYVDENEQGRTDLNNDGDVLDFVAHLYDARTGTTRNLRLAAGGNPRLSLSVVAFPVSESSQGSTDLNGDGDTLDPVVHVYDVGAQTTRNLRLNAATEPQVAGHRVAFSVFESGESFTDLNGDGDTQDPVLHVHDAVSGNTTNLQLAVFTTAHVSNDVVAFRVSEGGQGFTDLNGDGDSSDTVVHFYDAIQGSVTNVQLSSATDPRIDRGQIVFAVDEINQGNADRNGDGDRSDRVVHVHDVLTGQTTNLRRALSNADPRIDGATVVFAVSEGSQSNSDLNGDFDPNDEVVFHYDTVSGALRNLRLAVTGEPRVSDNTLAFRVSESDQSGTNLNGDLDQNDDVVHIATRCELGSVHLGVGPLAEVLLINGSPRDLVVNAGTPLTFEFLTSPAGPATARYALWAWRGTPQNALDLSQGSAFLGCTVNPTPANPGSNPQPFRCLLGTGIPGAVCAGVPGAGSNPASAPWTRSRSGGISVPMTFTLQGIVRDNGAASSKGYSITNAIVLEVR